MENLSSDKGSWTAARAGSRVEVDERHEASGWPPMIARTRGRAEACREGR